MSYTTLAVVAAVAALLLDQVVLRSRVTSTATWWLAYAIIAFFQFLTNGWLTGRRIVQYNADAIIGSGRVTFLGDGRLFFAPIEDVAFGFALVVTTCAIWTRMRSEPRDP